MPVTSVKLNERFWPYHTSGVRARGQGGSGGIEGAYFDLSGCRKPCRLIGTKHLHPVAVIVGAVFGALPDSFAQDVVDFRREVQSVPEHVALRVVADRGRRVALQAVLARRRAVGTEGALLLTSSRAIALKIGKENKRYSRVIWSQVCKK